MAKKTIAQLEQIIAQLQSENDELRARISKGHELARALKVEFIAMRDEVERVRNATQSVINRNQPVVRQFVRGGVLIEATKIGKVSTERVVGPVQTLGQLMAKHAAAMDDAVALHAD